MNKLTARVFNKVQGSFVDGYGIRTTLFLKGCPLSCIWCCNPEGQSFLPELKATYDLCDGCGLCVGVCHQNALQMRENKVQVDRTRCDGCAACTEACHTGALEMFDEIYSVDDAFNILIRDIDYYNASGGGVTIGGGEATCHTDFMLELIDRLHESGIHVAIDTCGYTTSEKAMEVLKAADLLLFDVKGIDPMKHKENTGCSNQRILNNLRILNDLNKPIIIRIPIITGYNDSEKELTAIAELLSGLHSVERVDLIPVHEFGKVKYAQLDKPYLLVSNPIPEERQERLRQMFESYGLKTQIGG